MVSEPLNINPLEVDGSIALRIFLITNRNIFLQPLKVWLFPALSVCSLRIPFGASSLF